MSEANNTQNNAAIVSRWGIPEADDTGYFRAPGFIMRWYNHFPYMGSDEEKRGKQVGLTSSEWEFITHVMSFHYDSAMSKGARPSLTKMSKEGQGRINKTARRLQQIKQDLIEKGALVAYYYNTSTPDNLHTTYSEGDNACLYDFGRLSTFCYLQSTLARMDKLKSLGLDIAKIMCETEKPVELVGMIEAIYKYDPQQALDKAALILAGETTPPEENFGGGVKDISGGPLKKISGGGEESFGGPLKKISPKEKKEEKKSHKKKNTPTSPSCDDLASPSDTGDEDGGLTDSNSENGDDARASNGGGSYPHQNPKFDIPLGDMHDPAVKKMQVQRATILIVENWDNMGSRRSPNYPLASKIARMMLRAIPEGDKALKDWYDHQPVVPFPIESITPFIQWYRANKRHSATRQPLKLPNNPAKILTYLAEYDEWLERGGDEKRKRTVYVASPEVAAFLT